MAFDWMQPTIPPRPQRGQETLLTEIKKHARLLNRLKFTQKAASARIQADLKWEFDADIKSTPLPKVYKDVPKIVKSVYKRG